MKSASESSLLLNPSVTNGRPATTSDIDVYHRRWFIIAVFFFCSGAQGLIYNTWGPINYSVNIVFGWKDTFTAMINAMSNVGYLVMALPIIHLAQVKGLRFVMLLCVSLLMVCGTLWIFGAQLESSWILYVGSVINGMTGGVFSAAPPLISVIWFPVNERTTATSIASLCSNFGASLTFILGPYLSNSSQVTHADVENAANLTQDVKLALKHGIDVMMFFDTILALICFVLVVAYFPRTPPKPPSHSATVDRTDFKTGIISLIKDKQHWLISLAYNIPNAVVNSWIPLVSISFRHLGITQAVGGWLGCATLLAGCLGSIIISVIMDRIKKRTKLVLFGITCGQIAGFTFVICIQQKYLQFNSTTITTGVLFAACPLVGFLIAGITPIFYELACESSFPVPEGLVCSFVNIVNNVIGWMFLFIFLIPAAAQDPQWMTWMCLVACICALPLLVIIKERYNRLDLEVNSDSQDYAPIA